MFDKMVRGIIRTGKAHRWFKSLALIALVLLFGGAALAKWAVSQSDRIRKTGGQILTAPTQWRRDSLKRQAGRRSMPGPGSFRSSHRPAARAAAVALSACMVFTLMPSMAFAVEAETGLCEHHPAHTAECGYQEATLGHSCEHKHTADCYTDKLICGYIEDEDVTASDSDAGHVHTQDCYEPDCPHERGEHDEECGYTEGEEGVPCGYVCAKCGEPEEGGGNGNTIGGNVTGGDNLPIQGETKPELVQPDTIEGRTVTSFDKLDETVENQTVKVGTPLEKLVLPDTLSATAQTGDEDLEPVVIEGVIWEPDMPYEGEVGEIIFTASAAGYIPAQGVEWPAITVTVEELYENAPGDADPEFNAWVTETSAKLAEVPALWERLLALSEDAAAMEQITEARAEKLAALNNLAERLGERATLAENCVEVIGSNSQSKGSYASLGDAISNAATGDTLKVLQDITDASKVTITDKNLTLNLDNKKLSFSTSGVSGGYSAIKLAGTASLQVEGSGELSMTNSSTGMLIFNGGSGTLTIKGGTISDTGSMGSLIQNRSTGSVMIEGGTLSASGYGKVVISNSGTGSVTVTGGTVSATGQSDYAIGNFGSGKITVGGTALVTSSSTNEKQTIYLTAVPTTDPKATLEITGGTVENTRSDGYAVYFTDSSGVTSDNLDDYFTHSGGTINGAIYPAPKAAHTHAMSVDCSTTEGDQLAFDKTLSSQNGQLYIDGTAVSKSSSYYNLPTGNYYLAADVELDGSIVMQGSPAPMVNLCLNGHKLAYTGSTSNAYVIQITAGTLNLCDCNGSGGSHAITSKATGEGVTVTGGLITGANNSAISVGSQSALNLYGGTIAGNGRTDIYGGGMHSAGGTFTMYGGAIIHNQGNYGGGVYIGGSLTIAGGTISHNRAQAGGGVSTSIYNGTPATVTLSGAPVISDNVAGTDQAAASNLLLQDGCVITVGEDFSPTSPIGVTTASNPAKNRPISITGENSKDYYAHFKSDKDAYVIENGTNNVVRLALPKSSDATLSSLSVTGAAISPAFYPATTSYTASVSYGVSSVTITAIAADSRATVSGDTGVKALAVGSNTFTVTVTAADGSHMSYTIIITRADYSGGGGSSSNDDNHSSSSSGGGSSVTVQTPTKPDIPTTGTTPALTPDKDGSVSVKDDAVSAAISSAKQDAQRGGNTESGVTVSVPVTTTGGQSVLNVTIPAPTLDKLVGEQVTRFELTTSDMVSYSFSQDALKQLDTNSAGGHIVLRAEKQAELTGAAKAAVGSRPVYDITMIYLESGKEVPASTLNGKTITIKLPYTPKEGEDTGNLYAVYVDAAGAVQWLSNSTYDPTQKAILAQVSHFSVYGVGCKPAPAFTDTAGHWAKTDIDFVVNRGLLSGTSATIFSPDANITRGMFVTALGRLAGIDPAAYPSSDRYTDVAATAYYAPYVEWAVSRDIVGGTGETAFSPDAAITREQMAAIMQRYADKLGYTLPVAHEAEIFADQGQITSGMKDAVQVMQQAGVMNGKGGHRFGPKDTATRAEAAAVLRRFVEIVIDPATAQGWTQNDAGRFLYYQDGKPVNGWKQLEGKWYYFDPAGLMEYGGWKQIGDKWYYFYADGAMAVSTKIDGYEIEPDGARKEE